MMLALLTAVAGVLRFGVVAGATEAGVLSEVTRSVADVDGSGNFSLGMPASTQPRQLRSRFRIPSWS